MKVSSRLRDDVGLPGSHVGNLSGIAEDGPVNCGYMSYRPAGYNCMGYSLQRIDPVIDGLCVLVSLPQVEAKVLIPQGLSKKSSVSLNRRF